MKSVVTLWLPVSIFMIVLTWCCSIELCGRRPMEDCVDRRVFRTMEPRLWVCFMNPIGPVLNETSDGFSSRRRLNPATGLRFFLWAAVSLIKNCCDYSCFLICARSI